MIRPAVPSDRASLVAAHNALLEVDYDDAFFDALFASPGAYAIQAAITASAPSSAVFAALQWASDGALELSALVPLLNERTRLVQVSLVSFYNGFRLDWAPFRDAVRQRANASTEPSASSGRKTPNTIRSSENCNNTLRKSANPTPAASGSTTFSPGGGLRKCTSAKSTADMPSAAAGRIARRKIPMAIPRKSTSCNTASPTANATMRPSSSLAPCRRRGPP